MSKMAVWKYVFLGVLVLAACLISVELHHGYIDALDDFPTVILIADDEDDAKVQMDCFASLAKQCGTGVAYVSNAFMEDGSTRVCFYCDESVKEKLIQYYHLFEGQSYAPFTGRYEIAYLPVSYLSVSDVLHMNCYPVAVPLSGSVNGFLTEWERQDGRYLYKGVDYRSREKMTMGLMWGFVVCMIVLVTVFERMTECKEFFVRLSVGDSLTKQILIRIGMDSVCFFGITTLMVSVCSRAFGPVPFVEMAYTATGALCVTSIVLFGTLMRNSFRYSFSNAVLSEDSLLFGFLLIAIFLVLLIVTASIGGTGMGEYRKVKDQKNFYSRFKNYYSVSFSPLVNDVASVLYDDMSEEAMSSVLQRADEISTRFYNQYASVGNACLIHESSAVGKYPVISVNGNMREYLEESFGKISTDDCIIVFYPKQLPVSLLKEYELQRKAYDYQDGRSVKWIPYNKEISLSLTDDPASDLPQVKNPVVVYTSGNTVAENRLLPGKVFYRISEETILQYARENQVRAYYCKVEQAYSRQFEMSRHQSVGVLTLAAVVGILDSLLLWIICYYECCVNRWEIAIKKTLGCNRFERFYRLYLLILVSDILGVIVAKYAMKRLGILSSGMEYIFLGGFLIIQLFEVLMVTGRIERESVSKVLKNG